MNIKFRQGSDALSEKLMNRAQTKLMKFSRFIPEHTYEAQIYVDVERESGANNSESRWRASINLDMAGDRFNASATGSTQDKAVDQSIKELKYEIQRREGKRSSLKRRGSGLLKRLRQGFS